MQTRPTIYTPCRGLKHFRRKRADIQAELRMYVRLMLGFTSLVLGFDLQIQVKYEIARYSYLLLIKPKPKKQRHFYRCTNCNHFRFTLINFTIFLQVLIHGNFYRQSIFNVYVK